jgi:hypothetical protein
MTNRAPIIASSTITVEEEPILPETTVTHPACQEQKETTSSIHDTASHIARHA